MRTSISQDKVSSGVWLVFYLALIISPVIFLFFETVAQVFISGRFEWMELSLPTGRRLQLLARSMGLASMVAVAGLLLALLAGSFLSGWRSKVGNRLKYMVLILAVVPPYVHALSWTSIFRLWNELVSSTFLPELPLYGLFISWWVQFMALAPFGVGIAILGFEMVDSSLVDAGRIMKSDFQVFKKIVIPTAAPALIVGSTFMFLISVMDYSIPSLFQVSTYSLEIFAEYSANYEPSRAFILSIPLLIIMLLAASLFQTAFRSLAMSPKKPHQGKDVPLSFPWWFRLLQLTAIVLLIVQIIVPLLSLTYATGSLQNLLDPIISSMNEIRTSLIIAIGAALVSILLIWAPTAYVNQGGYFSYIWWPLLVIPLTIPAPLIGVGIINLWNQGVLVHMYRTMLMPILVGVIRFVPFGAFIIFARYKRIDPVLFDAAKIIQRNSFQTFIKVKIPMFGKDIIAAASLVFILTLGELGATLLVVPPGRSTLTIKIYNYMHYGETSSVAGLSLFIFILSLGVGFMIIKLLMKKVKGVYDNEYNS